MSSLLTPVLLVPPPSLTERNRLIEEHLYQIPVVVGTLLSRRPLALEVSDMLGAGRLGLVKAAGRFEPSRGFKASTYFSCRIRGAVLELIRAHTGRKNRRLPIHIQLSSPEGCVVALKVATADPSAEQDIITSDERSILTRALAILPASDRKLLQLLFVENHSQLETALLLGRSPSQICLLKKAALTELRDLLRNDRICTTKRFANWKVGTNRV